MTDISRRKLMKVAGALSFATSAGAAGAKVGARRPPPATLYRSESFTRPFRDRLLRISIARPFEVEPDITQMVRGEKPVPVYVLDAVTNFPLVSSIARLMQWSGELPPCLVIGIGYHDEDEAFRKEWRVRELTPTSPPPGPTRRLPPEAYGGAESFRQFLLQTLQPEIERRFDVDARRSVLVGHSFGGLFTLDTMVKSPDAFGNYLAISPSLYFDDALVLRELKNRLDHGTSFAGRLAAFAGEREERAGPIAHMTSNVLLLAEQVAEHRQQFPNGALVSVVPEATHHSVVAMAVTKGLRFLISPEDRRTETF